jgi:hypothetical protein
MPRAGRMAGQIEEGWCLWDANLSLVRSTPVLCSGKPIGPPRRFGRSHEDKGLGGLEC